MNRKELPVATPPVGLWDIVLGVCALISRQNRRLGTVHTLSKRNHRCAAYDAHLCCGRRPLCPDIVNWRPPRSISRCPAYPESGPRQWFDRERPHIWPSSAHICPMIEEENDARFHARSVVAEPVAPRHRRIATPPSDLQVPGSLDECLPPAVRQGTTA